jgi:type II secretory pathway pseudopilin PulG
MHRHTGFSLIETLLAIGTLAVGMLFVGGTFMLGLHLNIVSTEKSIALSVENEAIAKIQLYKRADIDPNHHQAFFEFADANHIDQQFYPSVDSNTDQGQYSWRALTAPVKNSKRLLVTVFVLRSKPGALIDPDVFSSSDLKGVITDGSYVIADDTGQLLRFKYDKINDRPEFDNRDPNTPFDVWAVPAQNGRNPVIGVFQKEL